MTNKTSKIYIGSVEELIKDSEDNSTLKLRVRIPTLHGTSKYTGVPTEKLPIALPLITPGLTYNKETFENDSIIGRKVYLILSGGFFDNVLYLGIVSDDTDKPVSTIKKYSEKLYVDYVEPVTINHSLNADGITVTIINEDTGKIINPDVFVVDQNSIRLQLSGSELPVSLVVTVIG